ncbi:MULTISPECIES: STAS domain-containing protein [Rossellomorea]|uniref:STAS domain-containing protein n=1 Tax=Rossellomorea TaxID=2837508 RepID=UPI001CCAE219|nr:MULTISPECIES: STAS domain-containing protein [Rossellomorea]MCA0148454.1 STAS domain-containing protein [Rossellomorea vietnamensis]UTE75560.1 STAS domain-containing protein [Rossellomorea sp. KS-H15a]WGG47737.1 STAS domain-containing protein [Rossellomorea sp. DA94]
MHRNKEVHTFLLGKARQLTDEWYESLDKSATSGVYSSTDPKVIETLKKQNFEFHGILCNVFAEDRETFRKNIDEWVLNLANDKEHLDTPTHHILKEFMRVRNQYLDFLKEFADSHLDEGIFNQFNLWSKVIIEAFDRVMIRFVELQSEVVEQQLQNQQEIINELSSPVISLNSHTALLPLVGNIDPTRAELILENALAQCVDMEVSQLFIDLSGVVLIDTMVAHQIFQLIDALQLIGVKPILSGLRPEIAQTAVQLGLNFEHLTITSTLSQALTIKNNEI